MNNNRTLTAFFDQRTDAEQAISRLVQAGIARSDINLVEGENRSTTTSTSTTSGTHSGYEETGFWATLSNLFMPDEDRHTYAEGLSRGGYLVSLQPTDSQYDKALDILDDEGTIDLDQRATQWKSEGWSGYTGGASRTAGTGAGYTGMSGATGATGAGLGARTSTTGASATSASTTATGLGAKTSTTAGASRTATGDEVIPIAEERINIGKREDIAGRVRVRSYVVETPVHESVDLRQERVSVERRPVDRSVTGAEAAFKDRTIEATEKSERAVVNKEARVTEEVVLHKDAQTRKETINDTVRKTKVEVEDERNKLGTGATGTTGLGGTRKPV